MSDARFAKPYDTSSKRLADLTLLPRASARPGPTSRCAGRRPACAARHSDQLRRGRRSGLTNGRAIVLLLFLSLCTGLVSGRLWQHSIDENRELTAVSKRIGVAGKWTDVRDYVYCIVLVPGKTRSEIDEHLQQVASHHSRYWEDGRAIVVFDNDFVRVALGDLHLWFNVDDELTDKGRLAGLEIEMITCP